METLYQDYKDQGLMVITLIVENGDSQTPSQEDLKEWADEYGQTFPVLSDPDWAVTELYSERGTPALPTMTLIGPGAEVLVAVTKMTEEQIAAKL